MDGERERERERGRFRSGLEEKSEESVWWGGAQGGGVGSAVLPGAQRVLTLAQPPVHKTSQSPLTSVATRTPLESADTSVAGAFTMWEGS